MSLRTRLRWCVVGVLTLGVVTYIVSEQDALLALVALPLLAIGLWLTRPASGASRGAVLPGLLVPLLILLATTLAMMRARAVGFDVTLIAYFAVALLLIKLGDRRTVRDEAQLISLAAFLTVAAVLTSPELLVGLFAMLFFPLLIYGVMIYQLYRGQTEATPEPVDATPVGLIGSIARSAAFSALGCVAVAALIFIITPRGLGEGFVGTLTGPRAGSSTGFTDTVSLGRRGVISESTEIVLDLRVSRGKDPLGGPGRAFYLRGAVLDEYDSEAYSWKSGTTKYSEQEFGSSPGFNQVFPIEQSESPLELEITLRAMPRNSAHLFTAWKPVQLAFTRRVNLQHDLAARVFRASTTGSGAFTYRVLVETRPNHRSFVDRQDATVGFPSVLIRQRATAILQDASIESRPTRRSWRSDEDAARAIADFFLTGFEYTLEQPPVTPGIDPIEEFLFNTKRGHCEYFASAMVALCRSVGIQSRIVTGYVANEYDEPSGLYVVRQDDAHAWVEVQAGAHDHWVRFDPTPPADLARVQRQSLDLVGYFRRWLDRLEFAWNRSIVNFDDNARKRLLPFDSNDRASGGVSNWIRDLTPDAPVRRGRLLPAILTGIIVAGIAAVVLRLLTRLVARLGRRHRRVRALLRGVPAGPSLRESASLYASLLTLWERRREAKPEWRPPLTHAQALAAGPLAGQSSSDALEDASTAIISLLYATRFGGEEPATVRFDQARAFLARAEEAARAEGR